MRRELLRTSVVRMITNGTHPLLAAQVARYRADELIRDAAESRRARLARRARRRTPPAD
jgi:hypothetical protein